METALSLLGISLKQARPPIMATDEIIPMHFWDDTSPNRNMGLIWTIRFNDVLAADKLHRALARLLEIGDWRKLGGRIRLNGSGKLELHVPQRFTSDRPAVSYTHVECSMRIEEHPLASRMPRASEHPSLQSGPHEFLSLGARPGAPQTLEDYITSDEPQLSLHIVSFNDATLVSLNWPHTFADAMGMKALLNAWCLALADKEDQVPSFMGFRDDPMATIGILTQKEPFILAPKQLTGFRMVIFAVRYAWSLLWWRKITSRTISVPPKFLQSIKEQALSQLPTADATGAKPFLSDGDVLTAWTSRLALWGLNPPSTRQVIIQNLFDLRSRLQSTFQMGAAYVQNAVLGSYTLLAAHEVLQGPLGLVASEVRRSIEQQTTETQVHAQAYLQRTAIKATGNPTLFGGPSGVLINFTNWSKANFLDSIDFSPAVVRQGAPRHKRANEEGKPEYMHVFVQNARNIIIILGKDAQGIYWVTGFLPPKAWARIEEEMANT